MTEARAQRQRRFTKPGDAVQSYNKVQKILVLLDDGTPVTLRPVDKPGKGQTPVYIVGSESSEKVRQDLGAVRLQAYHIPRAEPPAETPQDDPHSDPVILQSKAILEFLRGETQTPGESKTEPEAQETTSRDTVRVNANFSRQAYEVLRDLAESQGKTMAEVLRHAVSLEKWYYDARRAGDRILVERKGSLRELLDI